MVPNAEFSRFDIKEFVWNQEGQWPLSCVVQTQKNSFVKNNEAVNAMIRGRGVYLESQSSFKWESGLMDGHPFYIDDQDEEEQEKFRSDFEKNPWKFYDRFLYNFFRSHVIRPEG